MWTTPVKEVYVWTTKVRPTALPITTPWIYRNKADGIISLSSDGSNWLTIADKNLWATQVWNEWNTFSQNNCGKFYQRWNNYWFIYSWSISTSGSQVNAYNYWPWNYYSWSTFITRWNSPFNWDSSNNSNLRWWVTWTVEAMQWPAPSWFHIPSNTEFNNLSTTFNAIWIPWYWLWNKMSKYLKMPMCWVRMYNNGSLNQTWYWMYWTAIRYDGNFAYVWRIDSNFWVTYIVSSYWCSIRAFKNVAVQPDTSWEKLN